MKSKLDLDRIKGVIPATITPLNEDGTLDQEAQYKLINQLMDAGCNGVMILGTAGEGIELNKKVRENVIDTTARIMGNKGVIVAGVTNSSFEFTLQNIEIAANNGADVALCLPPFFNPIQQDAMIDFYQALADKSQLPIIIYNMPSQTGNPVSIKVAKKMSLHENIIGIKDSSGDFIFFQKLIQHTASDSFHVFMGRAPLSLPAIMIGAQGVMTPISNICPHAEVELLVLLKKGEFSQALDLQRKIIDVVNLFSYAGGSTTANIKAIMYKKGYCKPYVAAFDKTLTEEVCSEIAKLYQLSNL